MDKTLEMRTRKEALCAEERKVFEAAQAENRAYTVEELEKIEKLEADMRAIDAKYEEARQEEAAAAVAARMSAPVHSFEMSGNMGAAGAGINAENTAVQNTDNRWIRDMVEGRTTQTTSTLDHAIPKPLQAQMVQLLDRVSAVRQAAEVYTVASPVRIARQTGYATALSAVAEAGAATAVDPAMDEIDTSSKIVKGFGETTMTVELLHDSQFDLESVVMNQIAEAAGFFQDTQFCQGSGSSAPEGIFGTVANSGQYDVGGTALNCTKVTEALLTKLPPQYMGLPRKLIVNQAQAANLLSDTDGSGTGRLLLQQQAQATFANMPSMSILGTEILISAGAPTTTAADDVIGVVMTSGTYGIYDMGGFQMLRDPYSGGSNGLVKVNGYIRSAGCVMRPQSLVQLFV